MSGFAVTRLANAKACEMLATVDALVTSFAAAENPVITVYFPGQNL